nr:ABC transporter ATP-binding protein [Bacillus sp. FJAT-27225]
MDIIQVKNVHKQIAGRVILEDVSFSIKEGTINGLLGPNGAGKTTMLRLMNGVIDATSGSMSILGYNPMKEGDQIRKRSGIVTESASLYHDMSASDNLAFFSKIYGVKETGRADELLKQFNLKAVENQKVGTFSTGMKKRLALAKALLHRPQLLFLDEPTNGLDPEGINEVIHYLKEVNEKEGVSILICSHVLHQLEEICDGYLFLKKGRMIETGTKQELENKYLAEIKLLVETNLSPLGKTHRGFSFIRKASNELEFTLQSKNQIPNLLNEILKEAWIHECKITNRSLESLYFKIKGDSSYE